MHPRSKGEPHGHHGESEGQQLASLPAPAGAHPAPVFWEQEQPWGLGALQGNVGLRFLVGLGLLMDMPLFQGGDLSCLSGSVVMPPAVRA